MRKEVKHTKSSFNESFSNGMFFLHSTSNVCLDLKPPDMPRPQDMLCMHAQLQHDTDNCGGDQAHYVAAHAWSNRRIYGC